MHDLDLEALAAAYRYRRSSPAVLDRARRSALYAGIGPGFRALDVGGGRGAHAGVFTELGARSVVVDRSEAMARTAAAVPGVDAVIGDAARLPFPDRLFDLVYCHLAIHYGDWRRNLSEIVRVAGGIVWIWTLGSDHHRSSYLAEWFPDVVPIDELRFPEPRELAARLVGSGLVEVATGKETELVRRTAGSWRAAVEAGFVSTLQMISPEALAIGLERFQTAHPDPSEPIRYELRFTWIRGRRPSLR